MMHKSFFPIRIKTYMDDAGKPFIAETIIDRPENMPIGKAFQVIGTRVVRIQEKIKYDLIKDPLP